MHVVDTTVFFSPTSGGVRRYLLAKHAWLSSTPNWRHSIVVPGTRESCQPGGICTLPGIKLPGTFNYRLPLSPPRWSAMLDALDPDVLEVGDAFHPAWCAWRTARRRNIPLTAFFHSNLPQLVGRRYGAAVERAFERYVRWLYGRFDIVFAPSRLMCDYLQGMGVLRVRYQPLGVDTDVFSPARRTLDLRSLLGLPRSTRLLAYAGRFSAEKNLHVLREAFARLGDGYHLLLIGGGRAARLARNTTVVPYHTDSNEVARWLASSDALVHAGTKETFGLVIVEAMACGRPVVAVRAGAIPELVNDDVGVLAEPLDSSSLAAAIVSLYDEDLEARGRAARERAVRKFSWAHTFRSQMAAYSSVAARGTSSVVARPVAELR